MRFLQRPTAKLLPMMDRERRNRYLTIFFVTAPSAAIVWFVFRAVYENLTAAAQAVGYVDPLTQAGIDLGYAVMFGGTFALAAIAAWSLIAYLRLVSRKR